MSKCIIYARVNRGAILKKEDSIQGQIKTCKALAKRYGLKPVATFSDVASSVGSLVDRKGLLEAVHEAERTQSNVLVTHTDRLARSATLDMAVRIRLSEWGGVVISVAHERARMSHRIKEGIRLAKKRR